jgi:predicted nucleic acid-binding protein
LILYADSSALAKRYISESSSSEVETLLRQAEVVGTALVTRAEVSSALAKLVRTGSLRRQVAETILNVFRKHWLELTTIQLTEALVAEADSLAWEQGLRGYDAVHLASALSWQRGLERVVTLATFDVDLWEAGQRVGLGIWPEKVE